MAPTQVFAEPSTSHARRSSTAHSRRSFAALSSSHISSDRPDVSMIPLESHLLMARNSTNPRFCSSCIVQDNNPRVVYTGKWLLTNERGIGTTHSTTSKEASASLTFNGTRIMVFGTIPKSNNNNKGPVARYILDDTPVLTTTLPVSSSQVRNQAFFSAQDLSDMSLHTLKIEMMQVDIRTPYILQHFFVRPHDQPLQDDTGGDPDVNGGVNDPTGGAVTTTSYDSPSMTPGARYLPGSEDTSTTSADPMQIVKILSGVLGGVIALILIALMLFFVRRKLKTSRESGRIWSKFWRYSPGPHDHPRPETMFTSFTTPESIARNDPAMLVRGSSAYTKSDGRSELLFAGSMFGPSPPPEPWITPPKGTRF